MRRKLLRLFPAAVVGIIGAVALTLALHTPGTIPTIPSDQHISYGASLYVEDSQGHRRVIDSWEVYGTPKKNHPNLRMVGLELQNASNGGYGPSRGDDWKLYGVNYRQSFACALFMVCHTSYDQQYVGGWLNSGDWSFNGGVVQHYRAQYRTCSNEAGIVPPSCAFVKYETKTATTSRTAWGPLQGMMQFDYVGDVVLLRHWGGGAYSYETLNGEMHMMADGTMWWDAYCRGDCNNAWHQF